MLNGNVPAAIINFPVDFKIVSNSLISAVALLNLRVKLKGPSTDYKVYTEDAGCAITTTIPVKFGTAHGRSRPEVGSTKRIDVYGGGRVSRPSLIIGNS